MLTQKQFHDLRMNVFVFMYVNLHKKNQDQTLQSFPGIMEQNNNQQQTSQSKSSPNIKLFDEPCLSRKVLQLACQIQGTQKIYLASKKPMKYFAKVKRSLNCSKNAERSLQKGILSEKMIPPNLGHNLMYSEKPAILANTKLKNVFDAYKQVLQEKYKKRMRQMQKAVLKINISSICQNQLSTEPTLKQKNQQSSKRCSKKNLDPNTITFSAPKSTQSRHHNQNFVKHNRSRNNTSRLLETIDDCRHNFIRSTNKILNENSMKNIDLFQIKRKCYTENQSQDNKKVSVTKTDFNKTKNVSFKLPNNKKRSRQFIQKIGGHTYNLPQIAQNLTTPNQTISYLVKSLRKPSYMNENSSLILPHQNKSPKILGQTAKQSYSSYHTRSLQTQPSFHSDYSIFNLENQHAQQQYIRSNEMPHQIQKKNSMMNHTKRKNRSKLKYKLFQEIDGWKTFNDTKGFQQGIGVYRSQIEDIQEQNEGLGV